MTDSFDSDRRMLLKGAAAAGAALATPAAAIAAGGDTAAIRKAITAGHEASVQRLRDWIALPSIAAENRSMEDGCKHMMQLATDAGFQHVERVATDGAPGVFATMDNGAKRTLGIYFMYDVKQFDPKEWSSPPLEGKIVDKPRPRQDHGRARRHQSEGARGNVPCGAPRLQGGRAQTAGQSGTDRGGRGGDRLSAFRADRPPPRYRRGAEEGDRRRHPVELAGSGRRQCRRQSRREGRGRTRTDLDRRSVGTWTGQRPAFELQGDRRQPDLASGRGAGDARHA